MIRYIDREWHIISVEQYSEDDFQIQENGKKGQGIPILGTFPSPNTSLGRTSQESMTSLPVRADS